MNPPLLYYPLLFSHFFFTLFLIFGWISNDPCVLSYLFLLLILTIVLFFQCKGCILTKLEKKMSNSNFTVIDPLLEQVNISINRKSRTYITLFLFALSLFITIMKLL